jgi:hypothetical protein
MEDVTLEEVLRVARTLPPDDQRRLRERLAEQTSRAQNRTSQAHPAACFPDKNYALEYQWLRDHSTEYASQWVALDGDRLVSHGFDVRGVHAAAQASGVECPYLIQVEAEDALPFGGW